MENSILQKQLLPKKKKKSNIWDRIFIVTLLILPLTTLACSWIFVNFNSVLLAFKMPTGEWSLDTWKIVFRNFRGEINDPNFSLMLGLKNSLIWFFIGIMKMPFQLLVSYFFYKKVKGYRFFQVMFYLPSIISDVAMAGMFTEMISSNGPIGLLLKSLGVAQVPNFLADSRYAMGTLVVYTIWLSWGGYMLLFGGAMARIPLEILESARMDGVGPFREFISFIVPLVWPTMSTLLILNLTGMFGMGGPILLFTQGSWGTMTLGYWIYHKVLYGGVADYNEVAAMGLIFTVVGAPIIMFFKWLIERVPVVEF